MSLTIAKVEMNTEFTMKLKVKTDIEIKSELWLTDDPKYDGSSWGKEEER